MLSASKKKLFFVHRKIFQLVDPVQHQDVFSKGLLGEFCQLQPFQVEIYLFFPPKSPTEILKKCHKDGTHLNLRPLQTFF